MLKRILFYKMLAAVLPLAAQAWEGTGTIHETDTAIIVEYYGNPEDAKAARIVEERENKQAEVDAERQRSKIEQSKARTAAKQAARFAERDANAEKHPGEVQKEEEE